jgi:hypothetical protein
MIPGNGGNAGDGGGIFNAQNATASFADTLIDHNEAQPGGQGGYVTILPSIDYEAGLRGLAGVGPDYAGAIESRGLIW